MNTVHYYRTYNNICVPNLHDVCTKNYTSSYVETDNWAQDRSIARSDVKLIELIVKFLFLICMLFVPKIEQLVLSRQLII